MNIAGIRWALETSSGYSLSYIVGPDYLAMVVVGCFYGEQKRMMFLYSDSVVGKFTYGKSIIPPADFVRNTEYTV